MTLASLGSSSPPTRLLLSSLFKLDPKSDGLTSEEKKSGLKSITMVINNSTETSSPPTASSSSSRSSSRKRRRRRTRTDEEDTTTIDHRPSPPPSSLDRTQTSDPLHPPFLLNSRSHYHPNYPISTVMNQVSSQNITSTALNAIKSSIPINLKPPPLTSFVKLSYSHQSQSVLTPANKRSTPSPIKLSRSPSITPSQFQPYLDQVRVHFDRWHSNLINRSPSPPHPVHQPNRV